MLERDAITLTSIFQQNTASRCKPSNYLPYHCCTSIL